MQYLRLKRSRIIIGCFLLFAAIALAFPGIDLWVSGLFYDGRSFVRDQWWQRLLQDGLGWFLGLSMAIVVASYVRNKLQRRRDCLVDGRKVAYLFLVLIIGAGLIVNFGFKDHFGRARPRDVAEFGGTRQFTPAFVVAGQCKTNCSFSSGDTAAAFFSIALICAFRRRRAWLAAALALGAVVSLSRISAGAHFFSDTVVSFFVMLLVADVLHYYVVLNRDGRNRAFARRDRILGLPGTASP